MAPLLKEETQIKMLGENSWILFSQNLITVVPNFLPLYFSLIHID